MNTLNRFGIDLFNPTQIELKYVQHTQNISTIFMHFNNASSEF